MLLKALLLFLVAHIDSVLSLNNTPGPQCRCLFSDPSCWPPADEFDSLSHQLSQPLISPVPPESACYPPSNPSGNCTNVILNSANGNWRANQSGSMESFNFETFIFANGSISACYLNTSLGVPCEQGSVPPIGVDARSAQDVQAAVAFAVKWNLKVVVKSTGHDLLGRSSGRGSFMIWTHNMKNISFDANFIPVGGPHNETFNALTLGAGIQWNEAYAAGESYGRVIVGGTSFGESVGAASGYVLGGGHSVLSPTYGLAVDNVLQFTLVTSSASVLTVNAYSHPDLFWALRGGGGGTFGVVTSVTYNTHPPTPATLILLSVENFSSGAIAQSVVSKFLSLHPALADLQWGGIASFDSSFFSFSGVAPDTTLAESNAAIQPLVDFVRNATAGSGETVQFSTVPFDSVYVLYDAYIVSLGGAASSSAGLNGELVSRLFPRELLETEYEKVADTLLGLGDLVSYVLVGGGAVSKVDPNSLGLNPAWRKALGHAILAGGWADGTNATGIHQVENQLKGYLAVLEELVSTDGGSYLNEASLYEKNFQQTFFGDHYARLESIKDIYDPVDLFVVVEGVGSERWDELLDCRKA